MIRRFLTVLAASSFVLFAFASTHSAQERQVGVRTIESQQAAVMAEAERWRSDLIGIYVETEALIEYLAGYDFIRQSDNMKNYDALRLKLLQHRERIQQMPADQILIMSRDNSWIDKQFVNRINKISRSVRTDEKYRMMIQQAGEYAKSGRQQLRPNPRMRSFNLRGVIAAPAYIPPNCNYDDPSDYPSGVDLGIASGVAIALHLAADLAPNELMEACTMVPNPVHIAFAIAAGIADQVKNALDAVAADAGYCEKIRFYIEDKIKDDRGITTILMNDDYYLTFMLKSVRAALSTASDAGMPTNCGAARLTEALTYFDGSDNFNGSSGTQRVTAYRLLRNAFQNIGAASCVQ